MADKHLKISPTKYKFQPDTWWYEEPDGIHIVMKIGEEIVSRRILWRSIRASLKRKDKAE